MNNSIKNLLLPFYWQYRFWHDDYPFRKYMRRNKCIFIHIPKTAGTSIILELNKDKMVPRDHATWRDYKRKSPYLFEKYYKFSFVRNPWDRVVSSYHYFKHGGNQTKHDIEFKNSVIDKYDSFESFVLNYLNKDSIWSNRLFWPQWFFLLDDKNNLQVDFLGKFENIENDISVLEKKLNFKLSLQKTNVSIRKDYKQYFSEETRIKISELYSKDILQFNYQY